MNEQQLGLTIKIVSERTGVSVHTLRAWERRYGIPTPARDTANRYRLYDAQDIADVLWLKHQVEAGLSPALASALWHQQRTQPASGVLLESAPSVAALQASLEQALAASDEPSARQVLDQAFAMLTPEQVALQILEPTMQELGAKWHRNELAVWQEHLASNLIRQRILSFTQAQPDASRPFLTLVAACGPEEQHDLGLLLLALLARRQGWQVVYLGQQTPLSNLVPFAKPDHRIALSVTTPLGLANLIPLLSDTSIPREQLFVGGYLPNQLPRLREHLPGAFMGTTAQEAIHTLATSEPKPNLWTPPKSHLRAALNLQREQLRVAWQTIAQLNPADARSKSAPEWVRAQEMTPPTLFLIATLCSALAFDVPELVDAQGAWLMQLLAPRGVGAPQLDHYLSIFARVVKRTLEDDAVRQIMPLVERFKHAALLSQPADERMRI